MSFCSLTKGISPKSCKLCVCVIINKRSFEPFMCLDFVVVLVVVVVVVVVFCFGGFYYFGLDFVLFFVCLLVGGGGEAGVAVVLLHYSSLCRLQNLDSSSF